MDFSKFWWSGKKPPVEDIGHSLRFRGRQNLSFQVATQGSLSQSTFSCWVKKTAPAGSLIYSMLEWPYRTDITDYNTRSYFNDDRIKIYDNATGARDQWEVETDDFYRDGSAWYHVVLKFDMSASDEVEVYINNILQPTQTAPMSRFSNFRFPLKFHSAPL